MILCFCAQTIEEEKVIRRRSLPARTGGSRTEATVPGGQNSCLDPASDPIYAALTKTPSDKVGRRDIFALLTMVPTVECAINKATQLRQLLAQASLFPSA